MTELEKIIKEINKDKDFELAHFGASITSIPRIPFPSPNLNMMLYGGIPVGRVIEFAGPEGGGKTSTALLFLAECQKMFPDKTALFIDNECTFDAYWAGLLGVDVDKMLLVQPDTESAEDIFDIASKLIRTKEISICVLDSLASLVPKQIKGEEMEQQQMGGISRALTRFVNDIVPDLRKNNTTFIGINQVRDDLSNPYNMFATPGGKAWKHACSVRLMFMKGPFIDANGVEIGRNAENPAGNIVNVQLKKSKICREDRRLGYYTLFYKTGANCIGDTITCAVQLGYILKTGAWYKLMDITTGEIKEEKFQGIKSVVAYYKEHEAEYNELFDKVTKSMSEEN